LVALLAGCHHQTPLLLSFLFTRLEALRLKRSAPYGLDRGPLSHPRGRACSPDADAGVAVRLARVSSSIGLIRRLNSV